MIGRAIEAARAGAYRVTKGVSAYPSVFARNIAPAAGSMSTEASRTMHPDPSDEELMLLYRHGNLAAATMLFDRYQAPLLGYLRRMLGDATEAEDVLQDVFLRVHEARETFAGRGCFAGWLYRIATNLCHNRFERSPQARLRAVPLGGDERDPGDSPREALSGAELAGRAEAAIRNLPLPYRTVFLLRQRQGLSYEQLATVLDESEGALRVRFHRARHMLYDALAPYLDGAIKEPER